MNAVCVSILLGALLAFANAQIEKSMIPDEIMVVLEKCAEKNEMTVDDALSDCMVMDDNKLTPCGGLSMCMGKEFGFVSSNGELDIPKAVEEVKKQCERFGLSVDIDKLKECTTHCTDEYNKVLPTCNSETEKNRNMGKMMQCIFEDCIIDLM